MNREEIKEAFGEDTNIIRKGTSEATYRVDNEGRMKMRTDAIPNSLGTAEKILKIATGQGKFVYENPIQFAIALKGFEQWCIDKNVAPSYAGLAFYLNITKETLMKYTKDKTEFTCYTLIDSITKEYIYSSSDKAIFDKYIEKNFVVENNITISLKEKLEKNEYEMKVEGVTFAQTLSPIRNLLEMININKAEVARNPAWHIFLAKNNFGNTTQYVDQVQQQITVNNPLDEMNDEEILKAVESRPSN